MNIEQPNSVTRQEKRKLHLLSQQFLFFNMVPPTFRKPWAWCPPGAPNFSLGPGAPWCPKLFAWAWCPLVLNLYWQKLIVLKLKTSPRRMKISFFFQAFNSLFERHNVFEEQEEYMSEQNCALLFFFSASEIRKPTALNLIVSSWSPGKWKFGLLPLCCKSLGCQVPVSIEKIDKNSKSTLNGWFTIL